MKKLLVLFSLMFSCLQTAAFAGEVRVYTDYTPVRILKLVDKNADFDVEAAKSGLKGAFRVMDESAIPSSREDRDSWKLINGEIKADPILKEENDKKKNAKKAAIQKLKTAASLTDEEIKMLGLKGGD